MLDINSLFNNRYTILNKVASGSFGSIFYAHDTFTDNKVALKVEAHSDMFPLVIQEAVITLIMHDRDISSRYNTSAVGFANVYEIGQVPHMNYMAMDILGPSLGDLKFFCGGRFSLKTTIMIGYQLLERV